MKDIILTSLLLLASLTVAAQNMERIRLAFSESYQAEADSNYALAVQHLEKVYDRNSYMVNVRLGWLNYLNGDYPKSIERYSIAMKLMPYSIEAKMGYVLPLSMQGNWNEVIRTYEEVLSIDPNHSITNYRLGLIYYNREEYEKAYQLVEKVTNMYPFDYYSVLLLGWINLNMGKTREARVLFERTLLIIPDDASALEGLGLIK